MPHIRLLFLFCVLAISPSLRALDTFIRINQLGYKPQSIKRAVLLSESMLQLKTFALHDALTDEKLAEMSSIENFGAFEHFKSAYVLDFSAFTRQGAFYIKAGHSFSPTLFIDHSIYKGTADFLLHFMRQQRCDPNNDPQAWNRSGEGIEVPVSTATTTRSSKTRRSKQTPELPDFKNVGAQGGWYNGSDFVKYGSTTATAVFQLLFAYKMNPEAFADKFDAQGAALPNRIPDVLDEAKWGLDWLMKMYPSPELLYYQVGDDHPASVLQLPSGNNPSGWGTNFRPVYRATGKPEGLGSIKNRTTGIASIAGKYAAAFALGADMLGKYHPEMADVYQKKAFEAYAYGKKHPGVCQSAPLSSMHFQAENNWADDMQLAATQLYHLSFDHQFQHEAAAYGRLEPIIPWLFSDTVNHYQWYPFTNYGHFVLANSENPDFKNEFLQNIRFGLKRAELRTNKNPFGVGVPMVWGSNYYVAALATQCNLYLRYTADSSFVKMEAAHLDWLLGCNPWGIRMVVGLQHNALTATATNPNRAPQKKAPQLGAFVSGAVRKTIFDQQPELNPTEPDRLRKFQTEWAVYQNSNTENPTNQPITDGTASLAFLLASKQHESKHHADKNHYHMGGIIRTNPEHKHITLVFTANEHTHGTRKILKTLKKHNLKASFFLTGEFLRKNKWKATINKLIKRGHYIGIHSDQYLQYCQFDNRNALLIDRQEFMDDAKANFASLKKFGIDKADAPFFIPPYEHYNDSISHWAREAGLVLLNYTPGTLSYADTTIPEMRDSYYSNYEIYRQIMQVEEKEGLNGHILLFHLGADPRRPETFYNKLPQLLTELIARGYTFTLPHASTQLR